MATTPEFKYAPMFQMGKDDTEYYLLTKEGVSLGEFEGKPILKVSPEALTMLTNAAFHDVTSCCAALTTSRWPRYLTTPKQATTTSM